MPRKESSANLLKEIDGIGDLVARPAGYHDASIPKGEYGEFSKIAEEFEELKDAVEQKPDNPVMVLCELSDMIGAIRGYLKRQYGGSITVEHLIAMSKRTEAAFIAGERS